MRRTIRVNRPESVTAWIWSCGQGLWALSLPAFMVLKLTGVIGWSWWWVLSPLWIPLLKVLPTFRFNPPESARARTWNRGQDLWALSLPALIVLKLTGMMGWSWWWVLSPLWISGIVLAPVILALLALFAQHWYRDRATAR